MECSLIFLSGNGAPGRATGRVSSLLQCLTFLSPCGYLPSHTSGLSRLVHIVHFLSMLCLLSAFIVMKFVWGGHGVGKLMGMDRLSRGAPSFQGPLPNGNPERYSVCCKWTSVMQCIVDMWLQADDRHG